MLDLVTPQHLPRAVTFGRLPVDRHCGNCLPACPREHLDVQISCPDAFAALLIALTPALAQQDAAADYPQRPVKIIVSTSAGGGVDTVTQDFRGPAATASWGSRSSSRIAVAPAAISAPRRSIWPSPTATRCSSSQPSPITSNVVLYKKLNFDPVALEPVAVMSKIPNVLLVRQDFPAQDGAGIHRLCQSQSGKGDLRLAGPRHQLPSHR